VVRVEITDGSARSGTSPVSEPYATGGRSPTSRYARHLHHRIGDHGRTVSGARTFLRIYLTVYYALLVGAGLMLWRSGVLSRIQTSWIIVVGISGIGLGVLLWAVSRERRRDQATSPPEEASRDDG
jgi:hypothetical protein